VTSAVEISGSDSGNSVIRVVAKASGTFYGQSMTVNHIYTIAGGGSNSGDGIPALQATVSQPEGLVVDGTGSILLADASTHRIRVIAGATGTFYGQSMVMGDIYTIAGNASPGYSGDGSPATAATLNQPSAVTLDGPGNVVIADTQNQVIRVVAETTLSFYGQSMTAGDIYTVAGTGGVGYFGDGGSATAALLNSPTGVAVDPSGDLFVADSSNHAIRMVAAASGTYDGQITTAGDIYTVAGNGTSGFSGDGGAATSAQLASSQAVAVDSAGAVVIGDDAQFGFTGRVRVVPAHTGTYFGQSMTAGDVYTVAGNGLAGSTENGAPAVNAELSAPQGVTLDSQHNTLFSEFTGNQVRVVAANTGTFYGQSMSIGDVYTIAGDGSPGFAGDGGPAAAAELFRPQGVGVDSAHDIVIADSDNERIRMVPAASGTYFGVPMTGGDIYTIAGNGGFGTAPSGVPATGAELYNPSGAILDGSGNLVISDLTAGLVQVVANKAGNFYGKAMVAGDVYTVAGGGTYTHRNGVVATSASVSVSRVVIDQSGSLIMADGAYYRLRVVPITSGTFYGKAMKAGRIYTVAGNGKFGNTGSGGLATAAAVTPTSVSIGESGDLVIGDSLSSVVKVVAEATGMQYGQSMTVGHIYTIAGDGTYGFSGDGGPAKRARLAGASDAASDASGTIVIADTGNSRLRSVIGP
jgi:hypothetical protein